MSASRYKQDMPPSGGYDKFEWARKIPNKGWSGYTIFGAFAATTISGWTMYYFQRQLKRKEDLEMNDARLAISPLQRAEMDRRYMRQLRRNRDEENELMKDVPGWETGKWKGEPVFYGNDERFPNVYYEEYYAHCDPKDMDRRVYERHNH